MFDPQTHSLKDINTALNKLSQDIVGIGELPRGEFKPFIVIELKG